MTWGPFSAETTALEINLRCLHELGLTSDSLNMIREALTRAHQHGPSNISYEEAGEMIAQAAESTNHNERYLALIINRIDHNAHLTDALREGMKETP